MMVRLLKKQTNPEILSLLVEFDRITIVQVAIPYYDNTISIKLVDFVEC